MAVLRSLDGGTSYTLGSRTIVGRSSACHVRPPGMEVSAIHAEIAWDGKQWSISDLGSRNGTFVDGEQIQPGQRTPIVEGCTIAFGRTREPFTLFSAAPPEPMAISTAGHVVASEAGLLCLPNPTDPAATIFQRGDGTWAIDSAGVVATTADQSMIVVRGTGWRLFLPEVLDATRDAGPPRLQEMQAKLQVSRDQETITVALTHPGGEIVLEPRSHGALLLALANARIADKESGLAESEHGWMHREEILKELRIDLELLNVWVHRARQQVARADVPGAAALVERRPGTGQLRIGVPDITIERA